MNRDLELALLAYHHRHRSRDLLLIALSIGFVLIAILDVVITHHVRARPLVSFGVVGVLGLLLGRHLLSLHRPTLLELLRTGAAIRNIRRGMGPSKIQLATTYVDFEDGRTAKLLCLSYEDKQTHIEELLRMQLRASDA